MDDGVGHADEGLEGPLDQLLAALDEHLYGDVVGDEILLDQDAAEVKVGLTGRREADLDLFEPHVNEGHEHTQLARRVHRIDERLVAVTKVDRTPHRSLGDAVARPLPIGEGHVDVWPILGGGHRFDLFGGGRHVGSLRSGGAGCGGAGCGGAGCGGSRAKGAGRTGRAKHAVKSKNPWPRRHRGSGEHRYGGLAYMRRRSPASAVIVAAV